MSTKTDTKPKERQHVVVDHEAEFLAELLERRNYWKSKGKDDYAGAYQLILHKYTAPNTD